MLPRGNYFHGEHGALSQVASQLCPCLLASLELGSRVLFLLACLLVLVAVPARLLCFSGLEDTLAIVIMTCTGPYFLFFCRGFKLVGPMVIMIYRMLAQDLMRFGIIYTMFIMGFAQAYYIIFQSYEVMKCLLVISTAFVTRVMVMSWTKKIHWGPQLRALLG